MQINRYLWREFIYYFNLLGIIQGGLGTSGNAPEYEPYLQEIGAAQATDDVFTVSAYCLITNLEHADMAYEWQFNGVNDYRKIDIQNIDYRVERKLVNGAQTAAQTALSNQLKPLFSNYVNQLKLKDANGRLMQLDAKGNGSFKNHMQHLLVQSAQHALAEGTDLSGQTWLTLRNGKVAAADFHAYARFVGRQKTTPAFDGVDLSSGENQLFGDGQADKKHFTDFAMRNSTVTGAQQAAPHIVKLMNAMYYRSPTQYS